MAKSTAIASKQENRKYGNSKRDANIIAIMDTHKMNFSFSVLSLHKLYIFHAKIVVIEKLKPF